MSTELLKGVPLNVKGVPLNVKLNGKNSSWNNLDIKKNMKKARL